MAKLTHMERIQRCHIQFMSNKDWVHLVGVMMVGKVIIMLLPMHTAGTDGRDTYYDPTFLDQLNDKQLRFVVAHEAMHKALMHLIIHQYLVKRLTPRYGEKEARRIINVAQDYVINRDLMRACKTVNGKEPYMEPPNCPFAYDPKYDDDMVWDTIKIVDDMLKNGQGQGQGQQGGQSHDHHDWDKAQELTEAETKEVSSQIENALRQGRALSKKLGGNISRSIEDLLTPAVDWGQALRDYVIERSRGTEHFTYSRPNRRFMSSDIFMPSTYNERINCLAFYCDTSGSISNDDLQEVMSELVGCIEVIRPKVVDVMYWDTRVARHEHYEGEDVFDIAQTTKPAGGGGTSPSCVIDFYERKGLVKPDVAIWLSDGCVGNDWAEGLGVPAFWVISSGGYTPSHIPCVQLPKR